MGRWTEEISDFIRSFGVNPIYVATLIMLFLSYLDFKKLKKWDELGQTEKIYIKLTWAFTIVIIIASIINLLVDFNII